MAQMANELFAAPIPPSPAPTHADAGALSSPPPRCRLPPLGCTGRRRRAPFAEPSAPFSAPLDFSAIGGPVGSVLRNGRRTRPLVPPPRRAHRHARHARAGRRTRRRAAERGARAHRVHARPVRDRADERPVASPARRRAVRRERPQARVPDPERADPRQAPRLARQRRDDAEAASGHRSRSAYFYEHENSNIHRAAHTLAARATDAYESARESVRRFLKAPSDARDRLRARRDRRDQPRRAELGPAQRRPRATRSSSPGSSTTRTSSPGSSSAPRRARGCASRPSTTAARSSSRSTRSSSSPKTKLVSFTQVSNALGTITPAKEMIEMAHRHGARRAARRRAGRLAHAGRRAGARLRLLRLLRPQGLRADGHRRRLRPERAARRDAAVAGRREHDPGRDLRADDLPAGPRPLRGGDGQHRRRRRARRGARLALARRRRARRALRARAARVRDRAARDRARASR